MPKIKGIYQLLSVDEIPINLGKGRIRKQLKENSGTIMINMEFT